MPEGRGADDPGRRGIFEKMSTMGSIYTWQRNISTQ